MPRSLLIAAAGMLALAAPALYREPYRPQFHFSPGRNWTNDPNGLVFFAGEYHLFFQYNPYGDKWGHMSWGHAVSPDLLHWKELPVAIPEGKDYMIFTGSTVVDRNNSSGFCLDSKPCLVAVYTGHRPGSRAEDRKVPQHEAQHLAYSNDRARTFTQYSGNPVLDDSKLADFRDPKVLWDEASQRWVMVVSVPKERKVRFLTSTNLKQWIQTGEFGPAGAVGGDWECPEFFELPVDGKAGDTRWVLKIGLNPGHVTGGSGEQYFVGTFDGRTFHNENSSGTTLWADWGRDCYCALTFGGLPSGKSATLIGWMNNWQYADRVPTSPWRGQMTLPRELTLRRTPEGIRLFQNAAAATAKLRAGALSQPSGDALELIATVRPGPASEVGWRVLASGDRATVVGYDAERRVVFVDRTRSGKVDFSDQFSGRTEAPLTLDHGELKLHIFIDRSSVEVFANDGRATLTNLVFPESGQNGVEFYSSGGKPEAPRVKAWRLKSTWQ